MANQRLSMRKIIEILRLQHEGLYSRRAIARMIGASPTTISDYLSRTKLAGLSYPLPDGMDEAAVDALLFPPTAPSKVRRPEPDWPVIHQEMRRKGVTLELLWQEYRLQTVSWKSLQSILKLNLDQQSLPEPSRNR